MKEDTDTLRNVTLDFGINYMAAWHMIEFNVLNETQIGEDLKSGLIFEWLSFIDRYTDSNTNNFEEAVMKLFLNELSDVISIDLPIEELQLMFEDRNYAGKIVISNLDQKGRVTSIILFRLKLQQYLELLEIGAK
jgi:hypothetical protein